MVTYLARVWLPDRPGALGAVASRIGAVGGDLVGIDILERDGGRAIDELLIDLPDHDLVDLLVQEIAQVDGVDLEDLCQVAESFRDPRLDALETAAVLVGAATADDAVTELCVHACRTIGAEWGLVVSLDAPRVVARVGRHGPELGWVLALVSESDSSAPEAVGGSGHGQVVRVDLAAAGMALVAGRVGQPIRERERRQVAALARIVDTRFW